MEKNINCDPTQSDPWSLPHYTGLSPNASHVIY